MLTLMEKNILINEKTMEPCCVLIAPLRGADVGANEALFSRSLTVCLVSAFLLGAEFLAKKQKKI